MFEEKEEQEKLLQKEKEEQGKQLSREKQRTKAV